MQPPLPHVHRHARGQRLGAGRVYVEDLNGWSGRGSENKPAIDNPDWPAFIREAKSAAAQANIRLQLPPRFEANQTPAASKPRFSCCTWVQNISLDAKGGIGPCCMGEISSKQSSASSAPLR